MTDVHYSDLNILNSKYKNVHVKFKINSIFIDL